MSDTCYKTIELTGTSTESPDDAVCKAVEKAATTLRHLCWFKVVENRGEIVEGRVSRWQVTVKIGFTLEDEPVS
jgi:dodecin